MQAGSERSLPRYLVPDAADLGHTLTLPHDPSSSQRERCAYYRSLCVVLYTVHSTASRRPARKIPSLAIVHRLLQQERLFPTDVGYMYHRRGGLTE